MSELSDNLGEAQKNLFFNRLRRNILWQGGAGEATSAFFWSGAAILASTAIAWLNEEIRRG